MSITFVDPVNTYAPVTRRLPMIRREGLIMRDRRPPELAKICYTSRRLDLIQPRCVIQIEQPVNLRHMHVELSREIGFPHPRLPHRVIDFYLRFGNRRQPNRPFLSADGTRRRNGLPIFDVRHDSGFERIYRSRNGIVFVVAERVYLREVRETHPHRAVCVRFTFYWISLNSYTQYFLRRIDSKAHIN
jgi:hypothetical protein